MKTPPNGPFYLPPTPRPEDRHKYNAFGFRKDFGKAYTAYYQQQDQTTDTFKILRFFKSGKPTITIKRGLTLAEAQEHCQDSETSSKTATGSDARRCTDRYGEWFDGYYQE